MKPFYHLTKELVNFYQFDANKGLSIWNVMSSSTSPVSTRLERITVSHHGSFRIELLLDLLQYRIS